jgi:AmmeMemoRadiSam system protein B
LNIEWTPFLGTKSGALSQSREHPLNRHGVPTTARWSFKLTCVQLGGNSPARHIGKLSVHRSQLLGAFLCLALVGDALRVKSADRRTWMTTILGLLRLRLDFLALVFVVSAILGTSELTTARPIGAHFIPPIPSMYKEARPFIDAIRKEKPAETVTARLTGFTVPHHLVAADLIARGFWAASASSPDRIILLSPDHFRKTHLAFATTLRPFDTVLGRLHPDGAAIAFLLTQADLFEESSLFEHEHGIGALLPFVARFFPNAKIVPIAISVDADQAELDRAVTVLEQLLGTHTLIIQSTDFSHYLPADIAQRRDQETLNVLSAGRPEGLMGLRQSDHMDSKGAQYIQMRLQQLAGMSGPLVIANRNSVHYTSIAGNTTSYIVQLYGAMAVLRPPHYSDQQVVYFGGDVLLGRYLTPALTKDDSRSAILSEIRKVTGGDPMIVNLEGAVLDEEPSGLPTKRHIMLSNVAAPVLKSMGVVGASVANNHSFDFGELGLEETTSFLARLGIKPLQHDEIVDFGSFRLLALNFISKRQIPGYPTAREGDLAHICRLPARPPLLAFLHWGEEYHTVPGADEDAVASQLGDCGIGGIIGAHSHRASNAITLAHGGSVQMAFSLGNLLFDQNGGVSSGAILELRVFDQGTFTTRLIPIPNLYDIGRRNPGDP